MPIDFYYTPGSPPCRSVLLTAKALGLELNLKTLDLHHGEHMKPEFIKVSFRKMSSCYIVVLYRLYRLSLYDVNNNYYKRCYFTAKSSTLCTDIGGR